MTPNTRTRWRDRFTLLGKSGRKNKDTVTSAPSRYRYATLDESKSQIRLLTLFPGEADEPLRGALDTIDLHKNFSDDGAIIKRWEALSYCWGDQIDPESLEVSGKLLMITRTLHTALRYLRYTDEARVLWIDQICVNQEDLEERMHQVQRMSSVYENAVMVTAWLGEGELESEQYLIFLSVANDLMERGQYLGGREIGREDDLALLYKDYSKHPAFISPNALSERSSKDEIYRFLTKLCAIFNKNAWFTRLWVVQEAVLARQLQLQYGRLIAPWDVHLDLISHYFEHPQLSEFYTTGIYLTKRIGTLRWEFRNRKMGYEIYHIVAAFRFQHTADPRDKIYGVLGLLQPDSPGGSRSAQPLQADYKLPTDQVYRLFVLWHLENYGSLDALSLNCADAEKDIPGLPTWAANLSRKLPVCDRILTDDPNSFSLHSAGGRRRTEFRHIPDIETLISKASSSTASRQ